MRHYVALAVFFFGVTSCLAQVSTEDADTTVPTTTIIAARTGIRTDAPHIGTYHYFEVFQLRENWIYPDIGYIDFANYNYREVFVGGGRTWIANKRWLVAQELYYDQAIGPAAKSAAYIQP
jgi:hypothetical protein